MKIPKALTLSLVIAVGAHTPTASARIAPIDHICTIFDGQARISRAQLSRLTYIGRGNSLRAMRSLLGMPYCWIGYTEYFPIAEEPTTWIAVRYSTANTYQGYGFSVRNNLWR